jgi:hypothetical protein
MRAPHVIVLSSVSPNYAHFRAAQTVLAHVLQELARTDLDVSYAVAETRPGTDASSEAQLREAGVTAVPGSLPAVRPATPPVSRLARAVGLAREFVDPHSGRDDPEFVAPNWEVERLLAGDAAAAILFWDTSYEQLVPALVAGGLPVFGYLARPPFAAAQVVAKERLSGLRRGLASVRLQARQRRHFERFRGLAGARNICAIDAAWYSREGVACRYLPNTWPDPSGEGWAEVRAGAESRRSGIHILGNVGGLNATGNHFGMSCLVDHVLPLLDRALAGRSWTVNICGRFDLPMELARLAEHPHVALRGFVPDIDEEMAGNHIFLLLNNSGPYTGGYTRVIYAFATGACLIAHRRLADSMPELIAGENCLLGQTPEEITELIAAAAADRKLRARLGVAARRTYTESYHPTRIAVALRDMVMERLH